MATDRKKLAKTRVLSRTSGDVWRSMCTTIDAFGLRLSGFTATHSPTEPEPAPIHDTGANRFRRIDEVIDSVLGCARRRA